MTSVTAGEGKEKHRKEAYQDRPAGWKLELLAEFNLRDTKSRMWIGGKISTQESNECNLQKIPPALGLLECCRQLIHGLKAVCWKGGSTRGTNIGHVHFQMRLRTNNIAGKTHTRKKQVERSDEAIKEEH